VYTVRDLDVSLGTAGTLYRPLVFTNTGGRSCTIQGFPGVSFVTGDDGHQVGEAAMRVDPKGPPVTLKPGDTAQLSGWFREHRQLRRGDLPADGRARVVLVNLASLGRGGHGIGLGVGKPVAGGAGLDDVAAEGEPIDDRGAQARCSTRRPSSHRRCGGRRRQAGAALRSFDAGSRALDPV
jgi:hypothetical protein